MPTRPDFFVSYNRADRAWAEWLAWEMEAAHYATIVQAWDFRPGHNFVVEMQRGLSEAERTIAVLSADYLASVYTSPEWATAFAADPTGRDGKLVPVRVRDCDLHGLLRQIIYIDLVGLSEQHARDSLLAGLKTGRAKPDTPPAFPGRLRGGRPRPPFPGASTSSHDR